MQAFQDQLQQQAGSSNDSPQQQQWHHGGSGFSGPGGYSNTGSTDRDGKPSAGQKLEKLIPGTPEYKAAQRNNSRGYDTGRDTTTGEHYGGAFEKPLSTKSPLFDVFCTFLFLVGLCLYCWHR